MYQIWEICQFLNHINANFLRRKYYLIFLSKSRSLIFTGLRICNSLPWKLKMVKSYEALKVLVLDFSKIQFGPKCKFMYQKKIVWPGTFSQVWSIQFFIILEMILQKKRFKYLTYFKFHFIFVFDFKINKFKWISHNRIKSIPRKSLFPYDF